MPSKEMRRSTRVFGARVLRSGRRLRTVSIEGKHMRTANAEDWIELLENSGDDGDATNKYKENGWHDGGDLKHGVARMDVDQKLPKSQTGKSSNECLVNDKDERRRWGSVYQRKRKRTSSENLELAGKQRALEDKRYGKQFFRKRWRKRVQQDVSQVHVRTQILTAVVESSCGGSSWFACLLNSVLRYMTRAKVRLPHLASFLLSEPVASAYSLHGVNFLLDPEYMERSGVCKIFGARCFIPLFSVGFSAVPICFTYLHSTLFLRYAFLPHHLPVEDNVFTDDEEDSSCLPVEISPSGSNSLAPGDVAPGDDYPLKRVVSFTVAAPKLASRTMQLRNCVSSRSIQKRRSSLRTRRGRNPSAVGMRKANGAGFFGFSHNGIPFSPATSKGELRSSVRKRSTANTKELKSSLTELTQDLDSASCSANILVIDSDKCYRQEGAIITLEKSTPTQWFLSIRRGGVRRYSVKAQKVMRPCSCNRVTRAIMWAGDSGWKLEFPNRHDWLIFKELYRECSDRNLNIPAVNVIPVPGVHEVLGYADSCAPFARPTSYIRIKDDEVARALAKRSANYDMDSDDEEWLCKFNKQLCANSEGHEAVSEESFELIIDALEKSFFCSPEEYSDEKVAINVCLDLERQEVLEAVHSYWTIKRKQKRSVLLRVFQCNQQMRPQLISKTVLRKKRSFKRQASQAGRGKQRNFLQAMAAEQNLMEEENASLKVQEAKAAASRSEQLAIAKRQRAQLLMENADLAMYKAMMALRIAEAARVAKSPDGLASLFPG